MLTRFISNCNFRPARFWLVFGTVFAVMIAFTFEFTRHTAERRANPNAEVVSTKPFLPIVRKVYEYSLIPGGVDDAGAFGRFRMSDAVLREHFRDVDGRLVLTKLPQNRWMYASYRVSDKIYWTKNRVLIHAGENLLTDGKTLGRARCGNRLSETPETPVKTFQPPSVTTDRFTPEIAILMPPALTPEVETPAIPGFPDVVPPDQVEVPFVPGPPSGGEASPIPTPFPVPAPPGSGGSVSQPVVPLVPPVVPGPGSRPYTPPSVTPTIPTPEMSTWALMLTGLFGLGGVRFARMRRQASNL